MCHKAGGMLWEGAQGTKSLVEGYKEPAHMPQGTWHMGGRRVEQPKLGRVVGSKSMKCALLKHIFGQSQRSMHIMCAWVKG